MTNYANNAAGGTNGAAVTGPNSGGTSGDAFNAVTQGDGVTYDNTHTYGGSPLAIKISAGSAISCPTWQPASAFTNGTVWFLGYLAANPSVVFTIFGFYNGSTVRVRCSINSLGKLVINSPGGATITSTNSVPLNSFFLVEMTVVCASGTGGSSSVKLYTTPTSPTALEAIGETGVSYVGQADRFRLGKGTAPAGTAPDFWICAAKANGTGATYGPLANTWTGAVATAVATALAVGTRVEHDAAPTFGVGVSLGVSGTAEHDAAPALAVGTGLAVAGTVTHPAAVPYAVATTLTAAGKVEHDATVPLAVATAVALTGTVEHDAPVGLAVAAALGITATTEHDDTVQTAVTTALIVAATAEHDATLTLAAAVGLALAGSLVEHDTAALLGVATNLTLDGTAEHPAALTFAVDCALAATGTRTLAGVLPLLVAAGLAIAGGVHRSEPVPPDRTWAVPPENRGYIAPAAARLYIVPVENRVDTVPADHRTDTVPADDRVLEAR